jgi:hypothetical protein
VANEQDGAVPPRGWESPPSASDAGPHDDSLAQLIEQLLALVPDELRVRLTAAARQLLEALRALIDWCVAHLERRASGEVEVRDIPIL